MFGKCWEITLESQSLFHALCIIKVQKEKCKAFPKPFDNKTFHQGTYTNVWQTQPGTLFLLADHGF